MKTQILTTDGKKGKEINLPKCFSAEIREDIVLKVLEAVKSKQPYAPSPVAGNQSSASGNIVHRRHVWKTHYGKGISRIPRKAMSRKGSQFNWVGAIIPSTRGGRRAHPPKVISMMNIKKINKKELTIAFESALSATADKKSIEKKYERVDKLNKDVPFVVESKFASLKTKELLSGLKKILGENLFDVAMKKKKVRAGRGKMRGRKYKSNAGMLFVVGEKEKLKTGAFDIVNARNLDVEDLAKGGLGRLTVYTEEAIKYLGERK
ncbi:MAG: 50S ribosomal protein L4 [archaeon]